MPWPIRTRNFDIQSRGNPTINDSGANNDSSSTSHLRPPPPPRPSPPFLPPPLPAPPMTTRRPTLAASLASLSTASSEEFTLSTYLSSIFHLPPSLRVLCLTNLFCWMSLVSYSLYFTDFVGKVSDLSPKTCCQSYGCDAWADADGSIINCVVLIISWQRWY